MDQLATANLRAERIRPDHFPQLRQLHTDPKVMQILAADGQIPDEKITRRQLDRFADHWRQHSFGLWIFRTASDGQLVGYSGLLNYDIENRPEIGLAYAVLSAHWGRGHATQMAQLSTDVGFDQLDFPNIASWTLPSNKASQRVLEKVGFVYQRDFTFANLPHRFYRLYRDKRPGP